MENSPEEGQAETIRSNSDLKRTYEDVDLEPGVNILNTAHHEAIKRTEAVEKSRFATVLYSRQLRDGGFCTPRVRRVAVHTWRTREYCPRGINVKPPALQATAPCGPGYNQTNNVPQPETTSRSRTAYEFQQNLYVGVAQSFYARGAFTRIHRPFCICWQRW